MYSTFLQYIKFHVMNWHTVIFTQVLYTTGHYVINMWESPHIGYAPFRQPTSSRATDHCIHTKTDMIVVVPENDLSSHAIRPIIGFQWGKVLDWITTAFQGQAFNRSPTPVSWATSSACLWCTSETTVSDVAIKLDCLGKLCDDVWGCYWHKPAGSSRGDEHCYSGQSTTFCLHLSHCELGWVDAWWEGSQNVKWQKSNFGMVKLLLF
jgi:hypothetical protein